MSTHQTGVQGLVESGPYDVRRYRRHGKKTCVLMYALQDNGRYSVCCTVIMFQSVIR